VRQNIPLVLAALSIPVLILFVLSGSRRPPQREESEVRLLKLALPDSASADYIENPDPQRLVIGITRDGSMYISGALIPDERVIDVLAVEARLSRERSSGLANRLVCIMADEGVDVRHVRKILNWCRSPEIRIWRIEFATRTDPGPVGTDAY